MWQKQEWSHGSSSWIFLCKWFRGTGHISSLCYSDLKWSSFLSSWPTAEQKAQCRWCIRRLSRSRLLSRTQRTCARVARNPKRGLSSESGPPCSWSCLPKRARQWDCHSDRGWTGRRSCSLLAASSLGPIKLTAKEKSHRCSLSKHRTLTC